METDSASITTRPGAWKVLRKNRIAFFSLCYLIGVALVAYLVPPFLPNALKEPSDTVFAAPSGAHWFGTDTNGKDLLYNVLSGARISLLVGFAGALISLFIGTTYGIISGYFGGKIDAVMMRIIEILYSIPRILFIMIFIFTFNESISDFFGDQRIWFQNKGWDSMANLMDQGRVYSRIVILIISLGLIEWLTMARIVRGQVLVLKQQQFVLAARSLGQRNGKLMLKHLLPNLVSIILTYLTLTMPAVILDESFLSFLGLGVEAPAASWGSLLKQGASAINPLKSYWWLLFFPAFLMSTTLLALNFLGDGLRDAFDPRSAQ